MKHPVHIKKIGIVNAVSVWLVDGERVRRDLNENFVQSGSHSAFPFIPINEFWIDVNTDFREHRFFMDRFFAQQTLLDAGTHPRKAEAIAATLEKRERENALSDKLLKLKNNRKELIERIHKTHFTPYSCDRLAIWIVDGKLIRDLVFLEYDAGGHDRVYPWIPKNEIWIEAAISEHERPFILLHELHERFLMGEGKKYPEAHQGATIIEDRYRDHPRELENRIREELNKNIEKQA